MQEYIFQNIVLLRNDMRSREIAVTVFQFSYNDYSYYVVVGLLTESEREQQDTKYALVHLRFVDRNDVSRAIDVYANRREFLQPSKRYELRKFLHIQYQDGFHEWLESFYQCFAKHVPTKVLTDLDSFERDLVEHSLVSFSGIKANRIYPISMKRNGKKADGAPKQRTEYNGQLASIRCPNLYQMFSDYKEISFCFSSDASKEKTESEILENFRKSELWNK